MTAWTRAEVLAFLARWARLAPPVRKVEPPRVYDFAAVYVNGMRLREHRTIDDGPRWLGDRGW